jgi:hypothetical protein
MSDSDFEQETMKKQGSGFLHDTWQSRQKDEWLTPPDLVHALGTFDLDPCAPVNRPWETAARHYSVLDDGLHQPWFGRVWLNPPYGRETGIWLERLRKHGNGIALVFARTETHMFFNCIWSDADAVLFLRGRLAFFHVDGTVGGHAGAPSCLVAYGHTNVDALRQSKLDGILMTEWNRTGGVRKTA